MEELMVITSQQKANCMAWYCQAKVITQRKETIVPRMLKDHLLGILFWGGVKTSKSIAWSEMHKNLEDRHQRLDKRK